MLNTCQVIIDTNDDPAHWHINGSVQERRNSSALAMELRLSWTCPSMYASPGCNVLVTTCFTVLQLVSDRYTKITSMILSPFDDIKYASSICYKIYATKQVPWRTWQHHLNSSYRGVVYTIEALRGWGVGGGTPKKFDWGVHPRFSQPYPWLRRPRGQNRTLGYGKRIKIKPLTIENVTKLTTF